MQLTEGEVLASWESSQMSALGTRTGTDWMGERVVGGRGHSLNSAIFWKSSLGLEGTTPLVFIFQHGQEETDRPPAHTEGCACLRMHMAEEVAHQDPPLLQIPNDATHRRHSPTLQLPTARPSVVAHDKVGFEQRYTL